MKYKFYKVGLIKFDSQGQSLRIIYQQIPF